MFLCVFLWEQKFIWFFVCLCMRFVSVICKFGEEVKEEMTRECFLTNDININFQNFITLIILRIVRIHINKCHLIYFYSFKLIIITQTAGEILGVWEVMGMFAEDQTFAEYLIALHFLFWKKLIEINEYSFFNLFNSLKLNFKLKGLYHLMGSII